MSVTKGEVIALAKALGGAAAARTSVKISAAGGSVVSISDGADGMKAQSLVVGFSPIQDLHGYSNPWPAGGGKNLVLKTINEATINSSGGIVADTSFSLAVAKVESGVTYTLSNSGTALAPNVVAYYDSEPIVGSVSFDGSRSTGITATFTASHTGYICMRYTTAQATEVQLEKGSTATSYSPYSNICPISGRTGLNVYHSGEDTSNPTIYPISWESEAGTVYGGTVDLVSGVLTVTHGMVDLGTLNWSKNATYPGLFNGGLTIFSTRVSTPRHICSIFIATDSTTVISLNNSIAISGDGYRIYAHDDSYETADTFKTAIKGAQLVYKLDEPQTYQLTPQTVRMLLGVNNVWASDGTIQSMDYTADTKLYIDAVAPHGDGIADSNITSGDFFMDGSKLYVATATIAAGDALVPGTNCTEMSIADALNAINS